MRCPKCHYLSFEPESRCRNCGYDFALATSAVDDEELSIKPADAPEAPLADLDLRDRTSGPRPVAPVTLALEMDWQPAERRASSAAAVAVAVAVADPPPAPVASPAPAPPAPALAASTAPAPAPRAVPQRAPTTTTELPLFVRGLPPPALPGENAAFDVPAALAAHTPRPPLSVRRRAPESTPMASPSQAPPLARLGSPFSGLATAKSVKTEHGRLLEIPQSDSVWAPLTAADQKAATEATAASASDQVRPWQRVLAALVDAALLGGIDAGIVWFTLRICALTIGQAATLPLLPLATFCVILDVGYLLMFTATSGQTVGKMAAGIRVVIASPDSTDGGYVTVRQAALRALLTLPSALAAGAGFLPALFGRGPAVHDRIAHTRVVRS
jgi:uncharacterized RDD family membrane protein YckC